MKLIQPEFNANGPSTTTQERVKFVKHKSLIEAILWTGSYLVSQVIVLIVFTAWLIALQFGFNRPRLDELADFAQQLAQSFVLIGVTSLGALFILVPLIRLRLGPNFRMRIGTQNPRHEEVIFAVATVIPIAMLGNVIYNFMKPWLSAGLLRPSAEITEQVDSLMFIADRIHGVPFPILVVALALGPAIGEELLFRGLISRNLMDRFGVKTGSFLTVVLFSTAHVSPAHAVATLPIACLLQYLYVKTGKIWIPILIHFLNNLLGVTMMRYQHIPEITLSPLTVAALTAYLIVILYTFEYRQKSWAHTATNF